MLNELKEKGFKEKHGCLIKETSDYTIVINPHNMNIRGYKDNVDFNRDQLQEIIEKEGLDIEVMQKGMQYFLETDQNIIPADNSLKETSITPEVLPSLDEMMELAPYISSDELEEGIVVKFLTSWEKVGEWNYKGRITPKYSIFLILIDKESGSAQMRRLDCGRNLISYLIGAMFLNNIKDIRGQQAEIKRIGSKQTTKYKIKFIKEETE